MEKRVCYISSGNIYNCPYLASCYLEHSSDDDLRATEVICWDREGISDDVPGIATHRFDAHLNASASSFQKALLYLRYRRFVNRILRENDYTHVVLLNTIAGYFSIPAIVKKYKGRYILDVRDYGGEKLPPLGYLSNRLVKNAKMVALSSRYYREFLGHRDEFMLVHNTRPAPDDVIQVCRSRIMSKDSKVLTVAFIGSVSNFMDQHRKLIALLCNDTRFNLLFAGTGAEALEPFCKQIGASNVTLSGRFDPSTMFSLYSSVDIVNNLYGNNTPLLDYALSNKLYVAAELGLPILVCPNTAMESETQRFGTGFTVDLDGYDRDENSLGDEICAYYHGLDAEEFLRGCDSLIGAANSDNELYVKRFRQYLAS